ncbi:hypothetical protein [Gimesia sp.]|uniref:hypothetical protein n=1 Tax=Gimesia sp. TaxID=2024833 RepID=UPI003A8F4D49
MLLRASLHPPVNRLRLRNIQRTLTLLTTSTPEKRNRVRTPVLFPVLRLAISGLPESEANLHLIVEEAPV